MTTKKQVNANKNNAKLSTGAKTKAGKQAISQNAVTHGIFSRQLYLNENESPGEYTQLYQSLLNSLKPTDTIQKVLIEKIAVDYWRIRRVLKFEASSIHYHAYQTMKTHFEGGMDEFFSARNTHPTDNELDRDVRIHQETIIECQHNIGKLKKDHAWYKSADNFTQELHAVLEYLYESDLMPESRYDDLMDENLDASVVLAGIAEYKLVDKTIAKVIIEHYETDIAEAEKCIQKLEKQKAYNKVIASICVLPSEDSIEKITRYERHLQKSILQNIALLKKLQEPG